MSVLKGHIHKSRLVYIDLTPHVQSALFLHSYMPRESLVMHVHSKLCQYFLFSTFYSVLSMSVFSMSVLSIKDDVHSILLVLHIKT